MYCSIITDTLEGHIQFAVSPSAFYLNTFFRTSKLVNVSSFNCTDKAESYWGGVISFLVAAYYALQTSVLSSAALGIGDYGGGNGLGAISRNIHYFGTILQGTVVVIGTNARVVIKVSEARTVIRFYYYIFCNTCFVSIFFCVNNRNNLQFVNTFCQSYNICTCIG